MPSRTAAGPGPAETDRILARAAAAVGKLAQGARAELDDALSAAGSPLEAFAAVRRVLSRHQPALVRLLTDTHLASLLAGMRRVVQRLPATPPPAGRGVTGAPNLYEPLPPASSPPDRLDALVASVRGLPADLQGPYLDALLPDVAAQVTGRLGLPPSGPPWALAPPGEPPPEVHLPLIEAAVDDLRGRRLLTRDDYDRLTADARREAFTVAGVESMKTLGAVQNALARAVREGGDLRDFRRQVDEGLDAGTFLSPGHVETVFRTNVQQAYSNGMDRMLVNDLVGAAFPYEETLPVRDGRLTELCEVISRSGIQGTGVFRRDDPVWQRYKPPRHYG